MKRKTIIQLTAALVAVGLVMIGVDKNTSKVAFAAFEGVEGSSEFIDTAEYAEEQAAAPVVLETENVISSEEMEAPLEEKVTVSGTENIPEESTEQTETVQTTETVMSETVVPETVETSAETMPETFSEAESSSASEEETEPSSTESALESAEQTTESQSETEEERQMLTMVKLNIDQDLETVPVAFLPYLDELNVDVYSLTLVYSDGSERLLSKEDTSYEVSLDYQDVNDAEGTLCRTYHVVVKEVSTGALYEEQPVGYVWKTGSGQHTDRRNDDCDSRGK